MPPMNVVVIMADQMRKDCLGYYGNPHIHTPNLDRLARESVAFHRKYVANPICMPNRLSILSGMYPSNHGLWTNGLCCGDPAKTLPSILKAHGYQTASIGKVHLSPYSAESRAVSFESAAAWEGVPDEDAYQGDYFGFSRVELTIGHTLPKAHYYKWFVERGGTDDMFGMARFGPDYGGDNNCGMRNMPAALTSSAYVGERAAHYLRQGRDGTRPFFLSVSFPDPHHPFTSCEEDYARQVHGGLRTPIGGADDVTTRPPHYRAHLDGGWTRAGLTERRHPGGVPAEVALERTRHTYAMVEAVDRAVGEVLAEIERQGLADDTIVLFLTDHGELLGDHGLWLKGPFFYEGLVNTPFLMRLPGVAHRDSQALVSAVDVAPTLLDLLGLPTPGYMDGLSLVPHLRDSAATVRDCCLIEYRNGYVASDCNANVLVTRTEKYACYEDGAHEYTDLARDPEERADRAGESGSREAVCRMAGRLLRERLKAKAKGEKQYGHA